MQGVTCGVIFGVKSGVSLCYDCLFLFDMMTGDLLIEFLRCFLADLLLGLLFCFDLLRLLLTPGFLRLEIDLFSYFF